MHWESGWILQRIYLQEIVNLSGTVFVLATLTSDCKQQVAISTVG